MATRTETNNSLPAFVADPASVAQIPGRQVHWDGVDDDFIDAETGKKRLKAGTVVGELADGSVIEYPGTASDLSPPDVSVALGILVSDANEDALVESLSGYGIYRRGVIYETLLPQATSGPPAVLPSQTKADLATAGCLFDFVVYVDDRAD